MTSISRTLVSVVTGSLLAVPTYWLTTVLNPPVILYFHAVLLGGIGAVYFAFALADGRPSVLLVESIGAALFLGFAAGGVWVYPSIMILGYFAHGFWDLAHHNSRIPGDYLSWYVPFCTAYDWAVGGYLLYVL